MIRQVTAKIVLTNHHTRPVPAMHEKLASELQVLAAHSSGHQLPVVKRQHRIHNRMKHHCHCISSYRSSSELVGTLCLWPVLRLPLDLLALLLPVLTGDAKDADIASRTDSFHDPGACVGYSKLPPRATNCSSFCRLISETVASTIIDPLPPTLISVLPYL